MSQPGREREREHPNRHPASLEDADADAAGKKMDLMSTYATWQNKERAMAWGLSSTKTSYGMLSWSREVKGEGEVEATSIAVGTNLRTAGKMWFGDGVCSSIGGGRSAGSHPCERDSNHAALQHLFTFARCCRLALGDSVGGDGLLSSRWAGGVWLWVWTAARLDEGQRRRGDDGTRSESNQTKAICLIGKDDTLGFSSGSA